MSKLLQVAHVTVLGVYTLSPSPYIWFAAVQICSAAPGQRSVAVPWAVHLLDSDSLMGLDASETERVLGCFFGSPKMMQGQ